MWVIICVCGRSLSFISVGFLCCLSVIVVRRSLLFVICVRHHQLFVVHRFTSVSSGVLSCCDVAADVVAGLPIMGGVMWWVLDIVLVGWVMIEVGLRGLL